MKVEYATREDRLEVEISEESDRRLFNGVADAILRKFKGRLIAHLDGFGERYWDIEISGRVVTLHLQHYTGITLFAKNQAANDLVRAIGNYLEDVEPKRLYLEMFYLRNLFRIRRRHP